ncbi:MAG: GWxTD domain-containing protein [Ignavibacteria bacterium]|nr:GWxTD domain-containing protein [Ignavibacteria bacterium]
MGPLLMSALCCGLGLTSFAQTKLPSDSMRIFADYSRFRGDENTVYVELCYSFPQRGLTYVTDSAGLKAGVYLMVIVQQRDSVVYVDQWIVPHVLKDTTAIGDGVNLVGISAMALGEGDYKLKMIASDRNNLSRKDSVEMPLTVRMFRTDRMELSDVELATSIRRGQEGSPFYKNTLEVIPNVEGIFTQEQRCFLYAEAYNLLVDEKESIYFVKTGVYDAVGREIISRERPRRRLRESSVIVDNISVSQLPSGTYTLTMALLDSARNVVSSSGKKFFVYNPTLGIDSTLLSLDRSLALTEYATKEEPEMDQEFAWVIYAATEDERNQYEQLQGTESKGKFLAEFWRRRPVGLKEEYLKRVATANRDFRVLGRDGYKTDRGRVYTQYGPPDDYDRHPNETNSRPYEIWTYHSIQGGVIFVFVERQSGGDHELVHSTHRNEISDQNWQRFAITR